MNKKNVWLIVIVVVLIVVVVGLVMWGNKVAKAPTSTNMAEQGASVASSSAAVPVATSTAGATLVPYAGSSFSLSYPDSWTVSPASFFSLTNFAGKYEADATIPMGGAEIDVVTTTVYSSVNEIMTTELMSANNVATSTVTIDNVPCQKASYQDKYSSGVGSQDISLYCLSGTESWKIYFSYRAGDSAAQTHIADFNTVLNSMKLIP
jgi:hypothetical protein